MAELQEIEAEESRRREQEAQKHSEIAARRAAEAKPADSPRAAPAGDAANDSFTRRRRQTEEVPARRPSAPRRDGPGRRQSGKMTITQALSGDGQRQRSLASVRRQREKARMRDDQPQVKQIREVIIPDTISVGELANRMAERTADVVKELMKLGVMATATQTVDGETAELIAQELGHKVQRVVRVRRRNRS